MRWRNEAHRWTVDGPSIVSTEALEGVRRILEDEGPVLVERAVYCGGGGREIRLFSEMGPFLEYLERQTSAGDRIAVWSTVDLLTDATIRVWGKCPNEKGETPSGGAF
jgi:hypothetical protein